MKNFDNIPRIQLLKDTTQPILPDDLTKDDLLVHHEMYDYPKDLPCKYVTWKKFKTLYSEYRPNRMILVGVNRMINPSNRCNMVNDYLQVMTTNIPKLIIDNSPFLGEPWRMFFHYSIAYGGMEGINYSHPIEGDWMKWFLRDAEFSMLKPETLKIILKKFDIYSDLEYLDTEFKTFYPSDSDIEKYDAIKEMVFSKYGTPKLLINNMTKQLNKAFDCKIEYTSYLDGGSLSFPEFGTYKFMIEENERRKAIYNTVVEAGRSYVRN